MSQPSDEDIVVVADLGHVKGTANEVQLLLAVESLVNRGGADELTDAAKASELFPDDDCLVLHHFQRPAPIRHLVVKPGRIDDRGSAVVGASGGEVLVDDVGVKVLSARETIQLCENDLIYKVNH